MSYGSHLPSSPLGEFFCQPMNGLCTIVALIVGGSIGVRSVAKYGDGPALLPKWFRNESVHPGTATTMATLLLRHRTKKDRAITFGQSTYLPHAPPCTKNIIRRFISPPNCELGVEGKNTSTHCMGWEPYWMRLMLLLDDRLRKVRTVAGAVTAKLGATRAETRPSVMSRKAPESRRKCCHRTGSVPPSTLRVHSSVESIRCGCFGQ